MDPSLGHLVALSQGEVGCRAPEGIEGFRAPESKQLDFNPSQGETLVPDTATFSLTSQQNFPKTDPTLLITKTHKYTQRQSQALLF